MFTYASRRQQQQHQPPRTQLRERQHTNGALRRGRAAAGQNEARLRSDDRGRPLVGAVRRATGAHVEQTARLRRPDAGDNGDFHARLLGAR